MKKGMKFLAVLLSVLMLMSSLAGCSKKPLPGEETLNSTTSAPTLAPTVS